EKSFLLSVNLHSPNVSVVKNAIGAQRYPRFRGGERGNWSQTRQAGGFAIRELQIMFIFA
ncbi:MAG: hypothetical protein ACK54P_07405, partial [Bacteroidota bacterium]